MTTGILAMLAATAVASTLLAGASWSHVGLPCIVRHAGTS
jgi:hypothetical protein